jgi:hypothetical protein
MYRRRVDFQSLSEFDVSWPGGGWVEGTENSGVFWKHRPFSSMKNQLVCFETRYPGKLWDNLLISWLASYKVVRSSEKLLLKRSLNIQRKKLVGSLCGDNWHAFLSKLSSEGICLVQAQVWTTTRWSAWWGDLQV